LNTTGWILVLLPFVVLILGSIWGTVHKSRENVDLIKDSRELNNHKVLRALWKRDKTFINYELFM